MPHTKEQQAGWTFKGQDGTFTMEQPDRTNYLYFPLVNEAGMMSSVSPLLHGDIKSSHYTFLTPPVSVEDLHNSRASRNFWVYIEGEGAWSAAGTSARQIGDRYQEGKADKVKLEAGLLWHKVTREHPTAGICAEIVSLVPATEDKVELMKVTLTNTGTQNRRLVSTAAIPLYGRSADELRDHRHVTSLLHRVYTSEYGVEVQPALSFDERGHRLNKVTYSVWGCEEEGLAPSGLFPVAEEFIGEGGSYDWPEAVVRNLPPKTVEEAVSSEGYEAVGGLRFKDVQLAPGESRAYIVAMAITEDRPDMKYFQERYSSVERFDELLAETSRYWERKLGTLRFETGREDFDGWMKWVTLQPVLRRLFGNSFLPYHDYGRGGRGWRDLWQDCLALLFMEPAEVRHLLLNNFAGVRIDGSNATIIGSKPGEFIADRNNIPRVWMDHGAWPFLTTALYLHQSGDLGFLLEQQQYFKDVHIKRCKAKDLSWTPESGQLLKTAEGEIYRGTVLEHLLLQNLVPFFLVGEHNNMKLEGADWNDGLDMAPVRGESVAFTAFYGSNLRELARLLRTMKVKLGLEQVELAEEMAVLLDTMSLSNFVDYNSVEGKHQLLEDYYESCLSTVSGRRVKLDLEAVAADLECKSDWIADHLRSREWISSSEGYEWFNGYYNNDGERVEGDHPNGVRMTLTGQVFTIMGGTATDSQVQKITAAVDRYLKDERIGYRLNSNFGGPQQNLGRAFGFAFGHKENGAMFSHMTVMYANALYKRGFVQQGREVMSSLYHLSTDFGLSRMYPGIPEYINEKGRGMYPYLTGSASWLLLTLLNEVYGVKGRLGDLVLEPKLMKEEFGGMSAQGGLEASVTTLFAGRRLKVTYRNPKGLEYGQYRIGTVTLNGKELADAAQTGPGGYTVERSLLEALEEHGTHSLEVVLQ